MHGGVGWQGIIPSRASKMASIAVDKGIAKLGSPGEFYQQLEPDKIAEHIITSSQRDIHDVVERIMRRDHARLWEDLPPRVRDTNPKRIIRLSSRLPTSRKIRLTSSGFFSRWSIVISFTSRSWSMLLPISSVTSRTMSGSCCWTRA